MRGSRPLTSEEVALIKKSFTGRFAERNNALFTLGINTGFRVSEILSLKLGDVLEESGKIKSRITVRRRSMKGSKTSRNVLLNGQAKETMKSWIRKMQQNGFIHKEDPIFYSEKRPGRSLTRNHVWSILQIQYKKCHLTGKLGTHAMRKTFANAVYNFYLSKLASGEKIDPFRSTSRALGHSAITSTDAYLSFREEDIDEAVRAVGI